MGPLQAVVDVVDVVDVVVEGQKTGNPEKAGGGEAPELIRRCSPIQTITPEHVAAID